MCKALFFKKESCCNSKKSSLSSLVAIILVSIGLIGLVIGTNNSLNQTNESLINNTEPLFNFTINASEQNLLLLFIQGNQSSQNISSVSLNQTNDTLTDEVELVNESSNLTKNESDISLNQTNNTIIEGISPLNESLNQTNDTPFNETQSLNQSFNLTTNLSLNISEQNLSLLILENQTLQNISLVNETAGPELATIINGKSIDTPYIRSYIILYNNFSKVEFEKVENILEKPVIMKFGNYNKKFQGTTIDNKNYVIHLVGCDREQKTCNFRVNGILAKELSPYGTDTFDLDDNYKIKINSIEFSYCDNRRFCDYDFQAYDRVEVEVVRR